MKRADVIFVTILVIFTAHITIQQSVVADLFKYTLVKIGCDTIRISDGRFDTKF